MAIKLSLIICSHNPREDYLNRTINSLQEQSIELNSWELLLIDNKSTDHLQDLFDLSWHPSSRTIREENIGLTNARIRGINESNSDLIIFIDDDNVEKILEM